MTETGAVWRDQLTAAERDALGRGHGSIPEPHPDILVVGGGIMGVATAAACHEAGLGSVLLIETGRLGDRRHRRGHGPADPGAAPVERP